ncbi:hypothetical protein [Streptomyces koyangensis]|uniref:Uncharacterized protein n=1 Tax=Streptomyces koyangensis TaxID=188770 RepID=A0ABX7EE10_9ACTN|nr:hypothetical protein [Streptomyces koyangensis]QRF02758.1 hypothetical protein G9U55_11455 [Streptomyces koyangensis]
MRTATIAGRPALLVDGLAVDIEQASDALFPPSDPQALYSRWREFRTWVAGAALPKGTPFAPAAAAALVPKVREAYARLAASGATAGAA